METERKNKQKGKAEAGKSNNPQEAEERMEGLSKGSLEIDKKLKENLCRDPQTGLYNRRYLENIIEAEFSRSRRYAQPFSVIVMDIDYFKSINDVYGYQFGDLVLKQFAEQLKKTVRLYDIVIRSGGEEFMIICPGTDISTALNLSRRLFSAIGLYTFGDEKHTVKLKLSMALASYPEDRISRGMDLVEVANRNLIKVKENGGNRFYSLSDVERKYPEKTGAGFETEPAEPNIKDLYKQVHQNIIEPIFAFARTIEAKDRYTGEHVEKTIYYATEIAHALNLPRNEIEHIRQAAVLHDLGKIGISEKILLKKAKLIKEEFEEIKKHPQIAAEILRPIHSMREVIPSILHHHERWDGKGYPDGLKGEEIPVGARIVAVADVYQALISDRPYRKRFPKDKAIDMIKEGGGTQFDPKVVKVFLEILRPREALKGLEGEGKILIVDDDRRMANSIARILKLENRYGIDMAFDGSTAEEKVSEFSPELVILDIRMPGIDGYEITRRIRQNKNTSHIKILAVSAYFGEEGKKKILSAGANACLDKPFKREKLLQKIDELL